jgi:hypothetical protein
MYSHDQMISHDHDPVAAYHPRIKLEEQLNRLGLTETL